MLTFAKREVLLGETFEGGFCPTQMSIDFQHSLPASRNPRANTPNKPVATEDYVSPLWLVIE